MGREAAKGMAMHKDIQEKIKQLCDSKITFESDWTVKLYDDIQDIMQANQWKCDDVIAALPEKLQTVYALQDLIAAINCDGFFSVFYNKPLYEIKRLRRAIDLAEMKLVGDLYDEAFQLVKSKFTWSDEHINFVTQQINQGDNPDCNEFFGDEIANRFEEIEEQISATLYNDYEKRLESYLKS